MGKLYIWRYKYFGENFINALQYFVSIISFIIIKYLDMKKI